MRSRRPPADHLGRAGSRSPRSLPPATVPVAPRPDLLVARWARQWVAWIAAQARVDAVALLLAEPGSGALRLTSAHGASPDGPAWTLGAPILAHGPREPRPALCPLAAPARAMLAAGWREQGLVLGWARALWFHDAPLGVVCAGRRRGALSPWQRRRLHAATLQLRDALLIGRGSGGAAPAAAGPTPMAWRALVEHSPTLALVLDAEGRIRYGNPAVARALGYPASALAGQRLDDLAATREDAASLAVALGAPPTSPWEAHRLRLQLRHRDGSPRVFEAVIADLRAEPAVAAVVVCARDVSEHERLDAELQQARKLEVLGRLASGVVHDFNNSLTVVTGYGELLLAELAPDDPRRDHVAEILKAGRSAGALVAQLLAFSRRQEPAPAVLDLNAIAASTARMLARLLGEHIQVETELEPRLGLVWADPTQVQQALLNLAANARDAMPQGGRLRIRTANVFWSEPSAERGTVRAPGGGVLLSVSDTGTGIPAEVRGYIFEPFFTTKEEGQGTGLGLATVYRIMRQNGGSVWVSTHEGTGTTFTLHFPRLDALPTHPIAVPPPPARALGSETVLLVEDEAQVRTLTARLLQAHGYTVLPAADARAAAALSARYPGPIHLLLTDVVLPDLRGHALAQQLAAQRPGLRVLYISGYGEDAVRGVGLLPAGVGYLPKPFTAEALVTRVRATLDAE